MKIKVVLSKKTADMLWALTSPESSYQGAHELKEGEVIVEINEEIMSNAIDVLSGETFDDAIRQLAELKHLGKL